MSLILIAPKKPLMDGIHTEGMVQGADLEPGRPPPWIVPNCFQCRVPVERFTVDWVSSPFHLPIQYQCHGKTGGMKIPFSEVMRASREHSTLWVFTETVHAKRTYVRR